MVTLKLSSLPSISSGRRPCRSIAIDSSVIATPAARAASAPAASGGGRTDRVTAPMPGVVLEVRVAPGATVTRGQALLVLEAMKMKNELKAPRDGVVAEIFVAAGAQVRYGEALLRFEASR